MEPVKKSPALIHATDEELEDALSKHAERVLFSYEDNYKEIQRRSQERNTKAMIKLTWAIVALAGLQVITAFIALFKE